ncbi:MAG: family 16 glycosylhydrolase [Caldilineaceae bacterium SB0665_bin_25]|nr:family 16 glycosylhydrolase [Caldilineaceae bacterium SB0665_bin_25]
MTRPNVYARFANGVSPFWRPTTGGFAFLRTGASGLLLGSGRASKQAYTNAQIDDYRGLPRSHFPWRPPLRLSLRARFSHESGRLNGTAGFGFWNDPLRTTGLRRAALPQALWFFYAGPDAAMPLALTQPAWGWKASVIDTRTSRFLLQAPLFALAAPLTRIPRFYRSLWPSVQRAAGIAERTVPAAMTDWHVYTIDWQPELVRFYLDGALLSEASHAPAGPLGLVIWLDNQFLQFTPWGRFRWGLVEKREIQWLEIDWLATETAEASTRTA